MEGKRGRDALKRPEIKIVECGEGRECQREWRCYAGLAECARDASLPKGARSLATKHV